MSITRLVSKLINGTINFLSNLVELLGTAVLGAAAFGFLGFTALLSYVAPLIVIAILAWEWNFIGNKNFLVSEQIEIDGHIFQRMSEIAFKPDAQNQTVMVEVISPSASYIRRPEFQKKVENLNFQYFISQIPYLSRDDVPSMRDINDRQLEALFKNGISEFVYTAEEKAFIERKESERKLIKLALPYIPPENKMMVFLKNCIVSELDKWMCEDQLPYLNGKNTYFGISNGEWVTDYLRKIDGYSSFEIIEWKSKWWFEKKRCGDICYIDSVANMDAKTELAREYLEKALKETD